MVIHDIVGSNGVIGRGDNMRLSEDVKPVAMLKLIAQSEADIEAGRTVSQDEAFARAERVIAEAEDTD